MTEMNDMDLVRDYASRNSESAFAELILRHINLVYSVAMRYVGNSTDAQDVTQAVFIILAKKSAGLRDTTVITGWLYETTRFTAINFLRSKIRRESREQEAYMESTLNDSDTAAAWQQVAPLLEDAMTRLSEKERTLLALHFFENKSGAETAAALGIEEWAARKRVTRAVEKLRKFFTQRGVGISASVLIGAITANSAQAAPTALATSISAVAITKGAAVSGSTLTLVNGALKLMAWTKAKMALAVGTGILLAAGTASVVVNQFTESKTDEATTVDESWRVAMFDSRVLDNAAPQVKILPTKFPRGGGFGSNRDAWMGIGTPISAIVQTAYHQSPWRTILPSDLPEDKYDFIAKLPKGSMPQDVFSALQRELKQQFGLVGQREIREVEVLFLEMKKPNAPGLVPSSAKKQGASSSRSQPGQIFGQNQPLRFVGNYLEAYFKTPVVNKVELTTHFNIDLKWNEPDWRSKNPEGLKQALLDQLGLELVPARSEIEILVVERTKD